MKSHVLLVMDFNLHIDSKEKMGILKVAEGVMEENYSLVNIVVRIIKQTIVIVIRQSKKEEMFLIIPVVPLTKPFICPIVEFWNVY